MTMITSMTPPGAPLEMPTQVLSRHPSALHGTTGATTWLARVITFGGSLLLTLAAVWQLYLILPLGPAGTVPAGTVALLWLMLGLFSLTFGWISLSAMAAVAGLFCGGDRYHAAPDAPLRGKTVLLMPVHNEHPSSACAALSAMAEELDRLGLAAHFEIFVLSDTREQDIWRAEGVAVEYLRERLSGIMPVWYRRRRNNTARKAGNIRDFINRWGQRYDYMVVLDADSLITGETLATLVREMDADPRTGILQTLPRLHGGETLFARLQQFAGAVHGPVFARGLCAWQGGDGNYWGHNAILRIRAFAGSAGLPDMPGPRPFGGEIRSHDFVEAALLRRAGWSVRMLPGLPGSWEECPPTLLDAAVRDRRWAQGNVQHLAVVSARGLRWPSRAHMLMGVMNYLTSPLWLALVIVGLGLSTLYGGQPLGPAFDSGRMLGLFAVTMTLLLLPKMLGLVSALFHREAYRGVGRLRLIGGALLELLFSVLHAPIVMMLHTRHLWEIARGRDSGWSAQQRRGRGVQWRQLLRRHGTHTMVGVLMTVYLLWLSSPLLVWMLPMVAGLVLSIPLSALSGSRDAGAWLSRRGLLDTPEEHAPPSIMKQRQQFLRGYEDAAVSARQPE